MSMWTRRELAHVWCSQYVAWHFLSPDVVQYIWITQTHINADDSPKHVHVSISHKDDNYTEHYSVLYFVDPSFTLLY